MHCKTRSAESILGEKIFDPQTVSSSPRQSKIISLVQVLWDRGILGGGTRSKHFKDCLVLSPDGHLT